jgi:DNA processing protein
LLRSCKDAGLKRDVNMDDPGPEMTLWLRLARMPGATIQTLATLIDAFDSVEGLFAAGPAGWSRQLPGDHPLGKALAAPVDQKHLEADLHWLQEPRNHLVPFTDRRYPPLLLESPGAPACLFVRGDVDCLSMPQLAVVGSRNPTVGGVDTAQAFSASLARAGLTITSGLALGIDSAAHRGALTAGGKTVAVMGTGLARVYPASNRELAHRIADCGALVSEFPLDAPPRREHFPQRNRIIAGLSLGTLVVEAAVKSGSLITARLAADYGREVFALPGSIHSPQAKGCHALIKQGAKLVEMAEDIVEELGPMIGALQQTLQTAEKTVNQVDSEFRPLLDAMGYDPVDFDLLVERSGLTPEVISSMLLRMELAGLVELGPGGTFQRIGNVRAH